MPNSEDETMNSTSSSSSSSRSPRNDITQRPNQIQRSMPNMAPFDNQLKIVFSLQIPDLR